MDAEGRDPFAGPAWSFLSGLRIVDCSMLLPGPYASGLLADLGADVVKVEPPEGDLTRRSRQRFAAFNRNKRSVVIDLKTAGGRDRFVELAATADAVIEGFRPGVMDRLGVGWEVLHASNPRLVLCSMNGFGDDGPYATKPGHDLNFLGLSGFFAVPSADGAVTRPGARVADMVGGLYGALSLAVALASAQRSGVGQHLDLAIAEAAAASFAPFAFALPPDGPAETSELVMGDNGVFETADQKRITFATFEDKFWVAFRTALAGDFPRLATSKYDNRSDRTAARAEVRDLLRDTFGRRDLAWWATRLDDLGLPWSPVLDTPQDLLGSPWVVARELFSTDAATGDVQVRFPTRFSSGLNTFRRRPPDLDEHSGELPPLESS